LKLLHSLIGFGGSILLNWVLARLFLTCSPNTNIMKTIKKILGIAFIAAFLSMAFVACENQDTTAKDVVDESEEFVEDQSENLSEKMEDKMDKIDDKLDELKSKMEPTDDDKKAIEFLEEKKNQLADWMKDANDDVKDEANDAMKNMKDGFNDFSEEVDEFLKKQEKS